MEDLFQKQLDLLKSKNLILEQESVDKDGIIRDVCVKDYNGNVILRNNFLHWSLVSQWLAENIKTVEEFKVSSGDYIHRMTVENGKLVSSCFIKKQ